MKIMFVHLLNNYTGSPRVLSTIISYLKSNSDYELSLLTSATDGCLSNISGIKYKDNKYKWKVKIIARTFCLLFSQIYQFFLVLFGKKNDVFYINTILPFGAAAAAFFKGSHIIYHIHEVYTHPSVFQKICLYILKKTASKIIVVSEYVKNYYQSIIGKDLFVVFNTVSNEIYTEGLKLKCNKDYISKKFNNKLILMPTGLKKYKGIDIFIELAGRMPMYNFYLVLSCDENEAIDYFKDKPIPKNIFFDYQVTNMVEYYKNASIVMNLTLPDLCIETFGMVLLEGAFFSTPSICPNVGGPIEIVTGRNGFVINPYEISEIEKKIHFLLDDISIYREYSTHAFVSTERFLPNTLLSQIKLIIKNEEF